MKTITLTEAALAAAIDRVNLTDHMVQVAENGHRPGVLFGSAIKNGLGYRDQNSVIAAVHLATDGRVTPGGALIGPLRVCVWLDAETRERVKLAVTRS